MTQAERRKLLLRRRQWQRFRAKLLALGIDYDNPSGVFGCVYEYKRIIMQLHDEKPRNIRMQEYGFDD